MDCTLLLGLQSKILIFYDLLTWLQILLKQIIIANHFRIESTIPVENVLRKTAFYFSVSLEKLHRL